MRIETWGGSGKREETDGRRNFWIQVRGAQPQSRERDNEGLQGLGCRLGLYAS